MEKDNPNRIATDKVTRKVILLSICEALDSLTGQELMQTALQSMYMDYFQYIELIDELLAEKLLLASIRKNETARTASGQAPERYSISTQGRAVLNTLRPQIPLAVSAYLHRSMQEREHELKNSQSILASWQLLPNGRYQVTLSLFEGQNRYFYQEIDVPNEKYAQEVCARWKAQAGDLFPAILRILSIGE